MNAYVTVFLPPNTQGHLLGPPLLLSGPPRLLHRCPRYLPAHSADLVAAAIHRPLLGYCYGALLVASNLTLNLVIDLPKAAHAYLLTTVCVCVGVCVVNLWVTRCQQPWQASFPPARRCVSDAHAKLAAAYCYLYAYMCSIIFCVCCYIHRTSSLLRFTRILVPSLVLDASFVHLVF